MSTGAPSNEKHALADELAQARALIEDGEYEAALDRLVSAWQCARAQHDADAVEEVRMLAQDVAGRALGRSDRQRADGIALALGRDPGVLGITQHSLSPVGVGKKEHPQAVRDSPEAVAPGAKADSCGVGVSA